MGSREQRGQEEGRRATAHGKEMRTLFSPNILGQVGKGAVFDLNNRAGRRGGGRPGLEGKREDGDEIYAGTKSLDRSLAFCPNGPLGAS